MKTFAIASLLGMLVIVLILFAAIAFGGPGTPAPVASIAQPFKGIDYSALPPVERFVARDGTPLAFRRYAPAGTHGLGSVVLVHGSSATGTSMHTMAQAFCGAGYTVVTLDMRGHGGSGVKGRMGYVGQLEDDIEDFVRAVQPAAPRTLIGFSSGGGFVLRFASDARQTLFDNYVLLSPFLSQNAPTQRKDSGGWVSVGLPRAIAIFVLNRIGITAFNDLPVTTFAVEESAKSILTAQYSFALADNFRPRQNYAGDIEAAKRPLAVLVGERDEAFHADRFAEVFAGKSPAIPVTIVANLGHVAMTLDPVALQAVIAAVTKLNLKGTAL